MAWRSQGRAYGWSVQLEVQKASNCADLDLLSMCCPCLASRHHWHKLPHRHGKGLHYCRHAVALRFLCFVWRFWGAR